jgi:hypothetical protein
MGLEGVTKSGTEAKRQGNLRLRLRLSPFILLWRPLLSATDKIVIKNSPVIEGDFPWKTVPGKETYIGRVVAGLRSSMSFCYVNS